MNGGETPYGRDFVEVVKKLAALAGVKFPERERTEEDLRKEGERNRKDSLLEIFLALSKAALMEDGGAEARKYLKGRGLSEDAARSLGLYSTRAAVRDALVSKGFTAEEIEASGLVLDGRWEGRLIIPWRDRWGYLGTFAARDLTGGAEEKEKYLYLKGTRKADLVAFGLDGALHKKPGLLVLVEGLLDVVNLQDRGLHNVAAIGGPGGEFSPDRWERLAAFGVSQVVLALDNDPKEDGKWPGLEGTLKALENVRKVRKGGNVPVVDVLHPAHLGEHKDPDALVTKEGADAFRGLLDKRETAALFEARIILGDVSPKSLDRERQDKAARVAALADTLRGVKAEPIKEDLFKLTMERTGYSWEVFVRMEKEIGETRLKEERERQVDEALRKAAAERSHGVLPEVVVHDLEKALSSLKAKTTEAEPPAFDPVRLREESKRLPPGKLTGWAALDNPELLGVNINPGDLVIFAARTGHCKTSVLVNLLANWAEAADPDELLVFYSEEEPEVRIYHRLLALTVKKLRMDLGVEEIKKFLSGVNPPEILSRADEKLMEWKDRLLIVSRPKWTVEEIDAHVRRVTDERKVGAVLVDYLQRTPAPAPLHGARWERYMEVSAVARYLKALAVDLSVPVVTGAQINREPSKSLRKDLKGVGDYAKAKEKIKVARPTVDDIREGGAEQEADKVIGLLNYAADFKTDAEGGALPPVTLLEVGALKNRGGVPGRWEPLAFEGKSGLIRDPLRRDEV
jgi:DNA primase